ncbi:hypothetical protein VP1G_06335 [Cytospora mali]|uniref:Major facilitator superfamily (MFS) profile domain-containing protein n=1 Tax=Cytospora mali TaxID=578113 RepID=A0A194V5F5_CYTMA|nr:hypothetical protein VP1G_06335 [Valsa mali var. pyri (nom. inval.)]
MEPRTGTSSTSNTSNGDSDGNMDHIDNSSPSNTPIPPVRWLSLPNKTQLFILALCRLSEPLSNVCLLPYIFYLVRSVLTDPTPEYISLYSGLLVASFPLAQFAVSLPWGYFSDRQGRKPSILVGLFVSVVANAAFGFGRSMDWLFFWRAVAGLANGNVGIMRTTTAEIVKERRLQTKAFLLLPLVFNSGMVVSLALGGILADPVVNLPGLFGPDGALNWKNSEEGVRWMTEYPYALPALMNAFVLGFVLVLAVFGLRETLSGKESERDWGKIVGQRVVQIAKRMDFRRKETRYRTLDDVEDLGRPGEQDMQLHETKPSVASPVVKQGPAHPLPFRNIWTRRTIAAMVSFGLLPLHNSAFMHVFPVFLSTPYNTSPSTTFPSIHFTGGLGLHSRTIGLWLGFFGICGILFQLYLFPRWQSRIGTLGIFKVSLFMFPAVYALAPFLSIIPENTLWSWIALAVVVWGQITARTMAIPSTVILLTEAAPARSVLGTVHGAGNMLASLARAVGPAVGGQLALVALGSQYNVVLQVKLGIGVVLGGLEVQDQVVLDGKDSIGLEPRVVLGVKLGGAALVVGVGDHNVDMGGAHRMAVHHLQQLPRGPVLRQTVGGRVQAVEPVAAVLVGPELAAQVVGALVLGVLEVVLAIGRGLPDVEDGAGNGLAVEVGDGAVHLGDAATLGCGVNDDTAAKLAEGRVGGPEGAQDGGGGRVHASLGNDLVRDLIDEAGRYKLVKAMFCIGKAGRQDGGGVDKLHGAEGVYVVYGTHPLINSELNFPGEVVEMADQGTQDLSVPGGGLGPHVVDDRLGKVWVESVGGHFEYTLSRRGIET